MGYRAINPDLFKLRIRNIGVQRTYSSIPVVQGPTRGGGDRREEERLQGLLPATAQQAQQQLLSKH